MQSAGSSAPLSFPVGGVITALFIVVIVLTPSRAAAQPPRYAGRAVGDVLRELQAAGLRIIFSSDLVSPALRVTAEPDGRNLREVAQQVLQPHGLTVSEGPRGLLLVVPKPSAGTPTQPKRKPLPQVRSSEGSAEPPAAQMRVEERVEVTDRLDRAREQPGIQEVDPTAIRETAGGFENVFQVLQVLPGVAATNDEDGRLAVRGAGPEHNLVVLDGVQIHNPYRFGELTSSFLNPDTAARVTLDASGLDAGHGGRLSSVTVIETRDGTRERRLAVSGSLGVANGDVLLEGRVPNTQSGSWWLTARGTYYRTFARRRSSTIPSFGDLQFKMTTRPSRRTSLSVFGLVGRETMHTREQDDDGTEVTTSQFKGNNRVAFVNFSATPNARLLATTTLSVVSHASRDFDSFAPFLGNTLNTTTGPAPFDRDVRVRDVAARQRVMYAVSSGHVVDAGVDLHRLRSSWRMTGMKPPIFFRGLGPSTWGENIEYPPGGTIESHLTRTLVGVWLRDRMSIGSRLSIEPGVRLDWNAYTGESSWQPRLRVTARIRGAAVWAGYAAQAQTPSHESLQGFDYFHLLQADGERLRNERSRQIVVGLERQVGAELDFRIEAYHRRFDRLLVQRLETDAERAARLSFFAIPPDLPPDSAILEYRPTIVPENSGRGTARGVEMILRHTGTRVSGWLGYAFSRTTREMYGYTFPFDLDRPHAFSAMATVQVARRLRTSATWLQASGFPVTPLPGEVFFVKTVHPDGTVDSVARPWRRPDGTFVTGPNPALRRLSLRNTDRLSGYSRADIRVTYSTLGHWEFYGEVINLFNTRNYVHTIAGPSLAGPTAPASELNIYENFERLPTAGVRFVF